MTKGDARPLRNPLDGARSELREILDSIFLGMRAPRVITVPSIAQKSTSGKSTDDSARLVLKIG
jgi:hypothetical protein